MRPPSLTDHEKPATPAGFFMPDAVAGEPDDLPPEEAMNRSQGLDLVDLDLTLYDADPSMAPRGGSAATASIGSLSVP